MADNGQQGDQRPQDVGGEPDQPLPKEKVAGRYQLKRTLGRGGFGLVYEAYDELEDRRVAVKVVRTPGNGGGERPQEEEGVGRMTTGGRAIGRRRGTWGSDLLRDEFRVLTQLHHPNLAAVYDFGRSDELGGLYFTQELIEGPSLGKYLKHADRPTIVDLFMQIARALDHLHALGLLHGDIKPTNILVTSPAKAGGSPSAKLIDFGLARLLRRAAVAAEGEEGRHVLGTPGFAAPETARGEPTDGRSDGYSLGVTIHASVRGEPPFPTSTFEEALAVQTQWRRELAGPLLEPCGSVVASLVGRMLEPDPDMRPQSARSIVLELLRRERVEVASARESEDDRRQLASVLVEHIPFVDRDGLLAKLIERTRPLFVAEPGDSNAEPEPVQSVVIRAPEGMGKQRLVGELRREVQLGGGPFVAGSCWGEERGVLGPFGNIVLQLASGLGQGSKVVERYGDLIRLARSDSAESAPLARLLEFLTECAAERPYVLHLSDLNRAQEDVRGTVEQLLRAIQEDGTRMLLLVTTTPHDKANRFLTPLGKERLVEIWDLPPFSREELTAVLRGALGTIPALSELVNMLETLTGGHPFAVRETLRVMIEEALLTRDAEGWALRASARAVSDLQGLLAERVESRLDRVGVGAWEVVTTLFLCDAPVSEDRLAELTDLRRQRFERLVGRLVGEGLVRIMPGAESRTIALAHESIREAVRRRSADSLDETRIELASRVEDLGTTDPSFVFLRGELLDDAAEKLESVDALEEAAQQLFEDGQHRLGARLLDRALVRLRRHGGVEALPRILKLTLLLLERAMGSLGSPRHEENHYRAGVLAAQLLFDHRAEALLWLGLADRFAKEGEDTDVTLERLERAAAAAKPAKDRALELRIASRWAETLVQAGFISEADERSKEAMEILDLPDADDVDVCHIIGVRIRYLSFAGRLDEAIKLHEIGKPIAARVPVVQRGTYLSAVAFLGLLGGDPKRALPETQAAVEALRDADTPRLMLAPMHNLGDLSLRSGDLESAAAAFREALRLGVLCGLDHQVHLNRAFLGYTLARMGQVDEGAEMLSRARKDAEVSVSPHVTRRQIRLLAAEVAHMLGKTAQARRELEEMVAECRGAFETSMADLAQQALLRIENETRTSFIDRSASSQVAETDPDRDTVRTEDPD